MKLSLIISMTLCCLAITEGQWQGKPSKKSSSSTTTKSTKTSSSTTTKSTGFGGASATTSTASSPQSKTSSTTTSRSSKTASKTTSAGSNSILTDNSLSASKSKLLFEKGQCPMTLCSGATISASTLENFKGSFKALSPIDVAVMYPDWSVTEIKAVQGGVWPANVRGKSCFEMKCPTESEISALSKKSGKNDALSLAKSNPNINLGRIQKAIGSTTPSYSPNTYTKPSAADAKSSKVNTKTKPEL